MTRIELIKNLSQKNDSKIVFVVIDGLGGIRTPERNKTELETADTPNLDCIAKRSACGMIIPVSLGITPGSGPAHFALFGYDPLSDICDIGRGVLEVLGLGIDIRKGEVAARGNFATIDRSGLISDRRAGRITSEECQRICRKINGEKLIIDGTTVEIHAGKEHRFAIVLRGSGLNSDIMDTDPQSVGVLPLDPMPVSPEAVTTVNVLKSAISKINHIISNEPKANCVLLRGFSSLPDIPSFPEIYKLNPAAIAGYPLYRGVAKAVGMRVWETGPSLDDELESLKSAFSSYDFFFFHVKKSDSFGEDGNFQGKVAVLEDADNIIGEIASMDPDVLIVTGDHSTPADMAAHSWHPVPFMIKSKHCCPDGVEHFSETECVKGSLGIFEAKYIMQLAMANAGKLLKFGA